MSVRLLSDNSYGSTGDVVDVADEVAAVMVEAGLAEKVEQETPPVEEAKTFKKEITDHIAKTVKESVKEYTDSNIRKAVQALIPKPNVNYAEPVDHTFGFKRLGNFLSCVKAAANHYSDAANRLSDYSRKAAAGANETTAADGGYLVPTGFSNFIMEKIHSPQELFGKTTNVPMTFNTLKIPALIHTGYTDGTRPIRAYNLAEADAKSVTKAQWEQITLELKKFAIVIPTTDELLADNAYSWESIMNSLVPKEFAYQLNENILRGSGAGNQFDGIIGHPGTVTVARGPSVGSAGVVWKDIHRMLAAFNPEDYNGAEWFVHNSVLPSLYGMVDDNGNAVYLPNNGSVNNSAFGPGGSLYGLKINVNAQCSPLNSVGDIILANLSTCYSGSRAVEAASSIHVYFLTDQTAFRWVLRAAFAPGWQSPIDVGGGIEVSPIVMLEPATS